MFTRFISEFIDDQRNRERTPDCEICGRAPVERNMADPRKDADDRDIDLCIDCYNWATPEMDAIAAVQEAALSL